MPKFLKLNLQFFADNLEGEPDKGNGEPNPKEEPKNDPMIPKSRFDEVNSKYKELSSQLAEFQKAEAERQAKAEEEKRKQAEEQGKYQELYTNLQKELEQKQTRVSRADELEKLVESMVNTKMEKVPKDLADLVPENLSPEQKLTWLNKAEEKGLFATKEVKEIGKPSNKTPKEQKVDTKKLSPLDKIIAGLGK